jgi:hypothetical protein
MKQTMNLRRPSRRRARTAVPPPRKRVLGIKPDFRITALFLAAFVISIPAFAEIRDAENQVSFIPLASYNYIRLNEQTAHSPNFGFGFMAGDYGNPYTGIHRSFFAVSLYQPAFFTNGVADSAYHQIDVLLDGRIERHNFFGLFHSASDRPVEGGLHTFYAGAAYGYEIIRRDAVSFIVGVTLTIGDFGIDMSNGDPFPVFPMPYIRLGFDTQWLDMSFDYLLGPNMKFAIAPESRISFTADMHMDHYRSIEDLIGAWTLWYRLFAKDSKLGDAAGIGIGVKNSTFDFYLAAGRDNTFEMQTSAVFTCLDFTVLRIEGGYVFDSRYLRNGEKTMSPGKGFYISLHGTYKF